MGSERVGVCLASQTACNGPQGLEALSTPAIVAGSLMVSLLSHEAFSARGPGYGLVLGPSRIAL